MQSQMSLHLLYIKLSLSFEKKIIIIIYYYAYETMMNTRKNIKIGFSNLILVHWDSRLQTF